MKRLMATALVAAMGLTMLGGCGVSKGDTTEIQASKTDKTETDKNKEVKLRVWSSASDMDLTNQMIDSFKAANSGTKFNIIVEEAEDADARDNLLDNVHGAADVFPVADDPDKGQRSGKGYSKIH